MALKTLQAIEQAVKTIWNGDEETFLMDAKNGQKNRLYRKDRNMKQQALLDAVKNNAEIKARVDAELAKKKTA